MVATFCYQITHGQVPKVDVDNEINLIYVGELIDEIIDKVITKTSSNKTQIESYENFIHIKPTYKISVSELLKKITKFHNLYFNNGTIPNIENSFDLNL